MEIRLVFDLQAKDALPRDAPFPRFALDLKAGGQEPPLQAEGPAFLQGFGEEGLGRSGLVAELKDTLEQEGRRNEAEDLPYPSEDKGFFMDLFSIGLKFAKRIVDLSGDRNEGELMIMPEGRGGPTAILEAELKEIAKFVRRGLRGLQDT